MKILAVSDEVVDFLYSPALRERFEGVDFLLGCGDLPAGYLEYLVTQLNVPLFYVPGNHDPDDFEVPGGSPIDGRVVRHAGLRIAGLGGSLRYKLDGRHQYTQGQMRWRAAALLAAALAAGTGIDILVTHAPPSGVHEGPDPVHQGFSAFRLLLRLTRIRLMVHGHSHIHANVDKSESVVDGARVLNVFPYRLVEFEA
ncbi:MAG: metallophosphoesterase family protein [Anaerolineales bacterium]